MTRIFNLPPRMADTLYHDMLMPDEVKAVRVEVRAFAERELAPVAHDIGQREEGVDAFPWELFRKMGEAGLFAIPYGKENGGRGLVHRAAATAVTIEELAYFSNSVAAIYDVHCILAGHALEAASPEVRARWFRDLIAGRIVGSFATSEPDASTDLSVKATRTVGEIVGDTIVLNGRKRWITNSPVAGFMAVLCKIGNAMTMVLVDLKSKGVRIGRPDKKLGNRAQLTADVYFENVSVPVTNLLGDVGQGLRIALSTLTYGRVGIAASGVGMAQSVFDECTRHLRHREAFGKKIGQFQWWQFKMAERATEIENARNLYAKAALRMDQGIEFPEPEAAMAKYYATALAADFARDGIQIFGGCGFVSELGADGSVYKVEEVYRDAKIAEIYEGTNEIQKLVIARAILGKDMTG
jgi:alkylation response protein AidB-like acyl-CoA dehydrogenase